MKLLLFTLSLLGAGLLCPCYSQTSPTTASSPTTAAYSRTDDFFLPYALPEDRGGQKYTFLAEYFTQNQTFRLQVVTGRSDTPSFQIGTFQEPLNYDAFYQVFYQSLRKITPGLRPLADASILSVFGWMQGLTAGPASDVVKAGNLCLKRWVYVFGTGKAAADSSGSDYFQERAARIDDITSQYKALELRAGYYRTVLDSQLTQLIPQRLDTIALNQKYQQAKREWELVGQLIAMNRTAWAKAQRDYLQLQAQVRADSANRARATEGLASQQCPEDTKDDPCLAWRQTLATSPDSLAQRARLASAVFDGMEVIIKGNEKDSAQKQQAYEQARDTLNLRVNAQLGRYTQQFERLNTMLDALRLGVYDLSSFQIDSALLNVNKSDGILSSRISFLARTYFQDQQALDGIEAQLNQRSIYRVNRVSIQFERGNLERIQVYVSNGSRHTGERLFENIYAIGMTSVQNFKMLSRTKLILRPYSHRNFIVLGDVVDYDNFLDLYTRDYSPADTVLNHINPSATPCVTLHKERLVNLLDTRIYTDLQGLRADQPNGLVQIEAARRFNIWSNRFQSGKRADYGFFNYLNAYAALTKIEEKDRRLPLRNQNVVVNGQVQSPSYVSTLNLRQWENASLGLDLNLALFDAPDAKFMLFLNTGIRYGHTSLIDSTRTLTGGVIDTFRRPVLLDAHSFTWQIPSLSLELFSERRVGLVLTYQYNFTRFYTNNNFKPVASYAKSDLTALATEPLARYYHMFELRMRIETSRQNNGRIFLRARYFMQRGDVNTFFPQIQLGYAYNLLYRK